MRHELACVSLAVFDGENRQLPELPPDNQHPVTRVKIAQARAHQLRLQNDGAILRAHCAYAGREPSFPAAAIDVPAGGSNAVRLDLFHSCDVRVTFIRFGSIVAEMVLQLDVQNGRS